ncbi:MAG: hypothetical protein M1838_004818 [Thelocarpon superellum]|nr:MAG: hypothetical protein M1838_004818 [Thelocarpon superellum]
MSQLTKPSTAGDRRRAPTPFDALALDEWTRELAFISPVFSPPARPSRAQAMPLVPSHHATSSSGLAGAVHSAGSDRSDAAEWGAASRASKTLGAVQADLHGSMRSIEAAAGVGPRPESLPSEDHLNEASTLKNPGANTVGNAFESPEIVGNLLDFDWQASFDELSATVNAYEPQGQLTIDAPSQQAGDFSIPPAPCPEEETTTVLTPPNPTASVVPPAPTQGPSPASYLSPPEPVLHPGVKRKAGSDAASPTTDDTDLRSQRRPSQDALERSRPSKTGWRSASATGQSAMSAIPRMEDRRSRDDPSAFVGTPPESDARGAAKSALAHSIAGSRHSFADIPQILPHEKVFPIQIGSELFRLSGASISSDAPSYFSQFFGQQLYEKGDDAGSIRTLYIDRDPATFRDISRHLQGYRVIPRDGSHYVRLFADAQFYYLPRLIAQLFESDIFIQIGDGNFQIPRDIFASPGDSPNYFSLGFAVFFAAPEDVFPGLRREGLLRPPSIPPPIVPHRSATVFAQLLHLLRGYPLQIRDDSHRAELLRDCKYYQFKGLEQKLIPHEISYNLRRARSEIVIRLEDLRQSGVSFVAETTPSDRSPTVGWVNYSRPFVDERSYELVVEVAGERTKLNLRTMRATFQGDTNARISSLFQVIANKMNLPTEQPLGLLMLQGGASRTSVSPGNTPLSDDEVKIRIERDAHVLLDGEIYRPGPGERRASDEDAVGESSAGEATSASTEPPRKRARRGSMDDFGEWVVRRGQWRLRVQPQPDSSRGGMEVVMMAVKLDAYSGEKHRNAHRTFLSG